VLAGGDVDDEEWLQRARAVLRERADLPEARISGALREAQEHAADHGTRLLEEFSSPEEYARSLPRDPRVKPRRMTLLYLALALGWVATGLLVGAEDGWSWAGAWVCSRCSSCSRCGPPGPMPASGGPRRRASRPG